MASAPLNAPASSVLTIDVVVYFKFSPSKNDFSYWVDFNNDAVMSINVPSGVA